ncbi:MULTISPECIES: ABC transporter permease [Halomicrobium]|uniref:Binding-protein-dependent transport systems inner membrane component n=2 Tax=Halomicrobium mukohataei TaxID=57705 RepID=C7NWB2_HALMD|nr:MULTISPECIES: ABC transporter permease [Halomicrobium]ACV46253.1 binding-protein-dependent transport systems inner membrane component [Halomicrobium mukohataei DSM 12286]MBO4247137.1 ABC transporter permease [Halomicrobium sp. IBSBa]NLV08424.1 ABC transporter permease subunit [Halomicrobium mukohataei]QCD64814.1 ABC transporter permease [Halomicrobium mukohataei]QFR19621.1 ABC transporter permease subunit [Halomicrobium sp. ZPS1]
MSRLRYIAKRVALSVPVVWLGTTMTWAIIYLGPIDPATRLLSEGQTQNPAAYEAARTQLGLDQPPLQHYFDWMGSLLTFDLGQTWLLYQGSDVNALILDFLPRTLWLGFWSVLIAVCIGVPLGFYAGMRSNTASDYVASMGGIVWRAMPNFWLGIMLLAVLGSSQAIFGFDWQSLWIELDALTGSPDLSRLHTVEGFLAATKKVLPAAIVLGSASMGNEMRIGRTAVLEVRNEDYVDLARAKGVSERALVWKHIFRNALIPLVPIITSEAFLLIGGSVLVETVFSINGIGLLFFNAATQGDLPLVGTLMYVFILLIVGVNLLQDVLYTVIDPRVGLEGA